jgi:hypothetical protein
MIASTTHLKPKGDELFLSADHVGMCFFGLERVVVGTYLCIIDDGRSALGPIIDPFDLNALDIFRRCLNLHTGESLFLYK